jgi:DNA-binding PadR family transcriptional regulator
MKDKDSYDIYAVAGFHKEGPKEAAKPMNASTLNHHIKALMKAGLVKNYYRKVEGKDDYSFYQITDLGRDLLKQIGAL